MAGSLRGNRLGQTRPGTPMRIDSESDERRVGLLLRELRINAQMRMQDVADAVNRLVPGGKWTRHTVQSVQAGHRLISLREQWALSQVFEVLWDSILETALTSAAVSVSPSGRLTEEQVVEIRQRYAAGESQPALCVEFGVAEGTVSRVVRGVSWKSAGGPIKEGN